jgi:hypothetical protein|tara:strand:+ start:372 stop:512 length:141 start_codon:yes stop_codon:yes gene_type:complete
MKAVRRDDEAMGAAGILALLVLAALAGAGLANAMWALREIAIRGLS